LKIHRIRAVPAWLHCKTQDRTSIRNGGLRVVPLANTQDIRRQTSECTQPVNKLPQRKTA